ncbi:MAG: hypothetical protein KI790_21335 [Cyclobacteriaceae bacterium]|nr:hypothetical protein [Cyclobacteriaceae bacterium HetDA_MAG_MS6]
MIVLIFLVSLILGCGPSPSESPEQAATEVPPTFSKPVQRQWKGVWALQDSTTFFTNEFEGGRLNGVAPDGDNHFTVLITAENTPINSSPWYAFKVWTRNPREVKIQLTYQNSRNRYYPKISRDGKNFQPLDSAAYLPINPGEEGVLGISGAPESIEITIAIDEKPTWVTAQELYTSTPVREWVESLSTRDHVVTKTLGRSKENRPIHLMQVGNPEAKKALIIITRQHPPEVTGFLAMKSFMETIIGDSEQAISFRDQFVTFAIPLLNPDGVDNGHWRHSMGGIDLNRDWHSFNQPETQLVRSFLTKKIGEGLDFVFGVDFHSTWEDVYYPIDSALTKNTSDLIVYDWINRIEGRLLQSTEVSPSQLLEPTIYSRNHFYIAHDMPAMIFELGDNTPRDFLKEKGKVAAEELMDLLIAEHSNH